MFFRPPRKRARIATSRRRWLSRCGLRRIETEIYTMSGRAGARKRVNSSSQFSRKQSAVRCGRIRYSQRGRHRIQPVLILSRAMDGAEEDRGEDGLSRPPKLKSKTFTRRRCNLVCRPSATSSAVLSLFCNSPPPMPPQRRRCRNAALSKNVVNERRQRSE